MAIQNFDEAMKHDCAPFAVMFGNLEYRGYFADIRINRESVPDGWHAYDMRHDDSGDPCEIKNGYIVVNHFGTFYTQDSLPLPKGESLYNGAFSYSFM